MRFAASTRVTRAACAWILAALAACSSDPVELEAGQACGDGPDLDGDGRVGACDPCPEDPLDDVDGDGVCGGVDNCPTAPNADQVDSDGDGSGDACDCGVDSDGDGVCDAVDPCPSIVGDVCPPCSDRDDDGVCDAFDLCPDDPENGCLPQCAAATFADVDQDGVDDGCDACPGDAGNDPDQDGVCAALDDCPGAADPGQEDLDGDGFGDACEPACDDSGDGDHDGVCDDVDDCPDVADPLQLDLDHDGLGIACDGAESLPAAFDAAHSAVALAARGTTSAVLGRSGDGATPASLVIVGVDRLRRLSLPAGAAAPFVAADGRVWTSGDRLRRESVDGLEDLGLPARVLADAPVAASGDAPGVLALRSAEGGGEVLEVWDAAGPRTVATATAFTGLTVGPSWLEVVRHEPGGDELALAEADGAAAVVRSASAIQALEPLAAGRGDHVWCAATASGCDVFLTLGATLPAASEVSLGVGCGAVTVVRDDGGTPWIVASGAATQDVYALFAGGSVAAALGAPQQPLSLAHTPPPGVSAAVIACAATPPAVCVEVWKASAGVAVRLGALGGAPFGAAFGPAGELAVATNRDLGFERGGVWSSQADLSASNLTMQSAAVGFAPDDTLWVTVATSAIAVLPGASAMSPGALQTDGGLVEPGLLAATGVLVGVRGGAYPGEHVNLLGPGKAAERYPSASGQPNTFLAADLGEAVAFAVRGAQGAAEIVSFPFTGGAATTLASGLAYRLAPRAPGAWARRALLVETPDDALWHRAEVGPDGLVIDPEGHVWGRGDALPGAWVLESGDGDDAVYRLCPLALDLPCGGGRAEVRALDAVVVDADGHPAAIARAGDGRRHLLRTWLVAP